jgi:UDP-N-acetylglucosamine:LPS N-acetylglucosamine transferase
MRALLVCSSGGHLIQLHNLKPWWERHDRLWVTFEKLDSTSLLAGEQVAWAYHPTTRNLRNLVRNTHLAWKLLRSYQPDVVVSSGAGVAFPFFLLAKLFGKRTVYVEVYCYPFSDLFLLQWEEQRRNYPKGKVIGSLL